MTAVPARGPEGDDMHAPRLRWLAGSLLLCLLAGCASTGSQMSTLDRAQTAWSAAIRWNDFDTAWQLVDPDYRAAHPRNEVEIERYKQIQVTGYTDRGSVAGPETATREIDIGVVNRHTMAERTLRHTERWRYDAAAKTWWVEGGLPDFWAGE
jgi:hypothetical protein